MRIKIVKFAVFFVFLSLFLALFNLEIIRGRKFKELSDRNCIRLVSQKGSRGRILDCQGRVIVDNELCYDAMILPQDLSQVDKLLKKVSEILEMDPEDLQKRLKRGYISSVTPITLAKNIELKKAIALEELKADFAAITIEPSVLRRYPHGRLACHLLGYLNEIDLWRLTKLTNYGYKTKDIVGFGGIEEKYDYYLRQEEGGLLIEVDHRGSQVRVLGFKPPCDGKDIQLTLDLKIQQIVEESLKDRIGSVVVMNPYSGEIIALANSPNFNPAVFVKKMNNAICGLFDNPDAPLLNRCISSAYPPGSVFKLVVAAAALEKEKVDLSKTFFCSGSMSIGREKFGCWNNHGAQNLIEAISNSCNVFFYKIALILGPQAIHDYALKFNLSRPTGIDLSYETNGFIPSVLWKRIYRFKNWFDGDTANLAIGQGDTLVTPLQVARLLAVFANGGYLVTPYIVKSVDGKDISADKRRIIRLHFKPATIETINRGLRGALTASGGTANLLSSLSVSVAGKTGTAQVDRRQSHGWFAGFFPYENPKFVICVFLEHGGSGHASCILVKQIIEAMLEKGLIPGFTKKP